MKNKFNIKLTAFLVSLFISLIIVILGSKFVYCLSFGFILMGLSLVFFVLYNDEKTANSNIEIEEAIDELAEDETIEESEKVYMLQQYYSSQRKLLKRKKRVAITFYLCAAMLVVVGFFGFF